MSDLDGMARREVRWLLEHRTHIDMGNVDRVLRRYEEEITAPYIAALRSITSFSPSDGCPGEEQYGTHRDVLHVLPYHCEVEGNCSVCRTLPREAAHV
jgi:hypothetical protein